MRNIRMEHKDVAVRYSRESGCRLIVEGLVGMAFLKRFNWCLYPEDQLLWVKA